MPLTLACSILILFYLFSFCYIIQFLFYKLATCTTLSQLTLVIALAHHCSLVDFDSVLKLQDIYSHGRSFPSITHPNKHAVPPKHTQTEHTHASTVPPQVLTSGYREKRRVFALGRPEPPSLFGVLKVHCAPLDSSESHAAPAVLHGSVSKGEAPTANPYTEETQCSSHTSPQRWTRRSAAHVRNQSHGNSLCPDQWEFLALTLHFHALFPSHYYY